MNDFEAFLWILIVALVAVHIVFGIIAARVASGKGRSPDLGFLAGFLLNIFGLIIVMLMRPSIEAEAQRRIAVEREYKRQQTPPASLPRRSAGREDVRSVTFQRSADSTSVRLSVVVLSDREQRALGLGILKHDRTIGGVLYVWPDGGAHQVAFENNLNFQVCFAAIGLDGSIEEVLTASPGDMVHPTRAVASAVAVPRGRFDSLEVDVGDKVALLDEVRP